jgi:hypothetical protein
MEAIPLMLEDETTSDMPMARGLMDMITHAMVMNIAKTEILLISIANTYNYKEKAGKKVIYSVADANQC